MLLEPDARLGQRAGLVGAEDVHAAEVVDGRQALDDDLLRRHADRARAPGVTETTIGSSSGVRPTASATANRNDSSQRPVEAGVHQQHEQAP